MGAARQRICYLCGGPAKHGHCGLSAASHADSASAEPPRATLWQVQGASRPQETRLSCSRGVPCVALDNACVSIFIDC